MHNHSKIKAKKTDASQPAFKPRTVKKSAINTYRDRASERRHGVAGDYAQVEALAEEFDRRAVDKKTLEEQRQYLGGDSEHTVLVKGLDLALLGQNKAKVAAVQSIEEDESLEQAFLEANEQKASEVNGAVETSAGRKRTREELVRELKNKRMKSGAVSGNEDTAVDDIAKLEEAKKAGKFKPIGFKPVGQDKPKKKAKKVKSGEAAAATTKKVKAKASPPSGISVAQFKAPSEGLDTQPRAPSENGPAPSTESPRPAKTPPESQPEPEPVDEDFDIFAGAGEYTGVDLGSSESESESEEKGRAKEKKAEQFDHRTSPVAAATPRKWIDINDDRPLRTSKSRSPGPPAREEAPEEGEVRLGSPSPRSKSKSRSQSRPDEPEPEPEPELEPEETIPTRLQPLSSSAIPSIRDVLAMDEEADKAKRRKARKEKAGNKGGKKLDKEGKVERDYQRLKSYTDKKAAAKS